ncbi:MAG TPA: hypothetical protein VFT22_10975 [Kofleriaceae bacterium]|nr:hypothetical protein [Kofleriaceae bacterium]
MWLTILRALRWLTWSGVGVFAIVTTLNFERSWVLASGAPQQCAAAGFALVEMMAAYIGARGLDRILMLVAEDIASRAQARQPPLR